MFKLYKSLLEQLVGRDVGRSPNVVSVPLKPGQLATKRMGADARRGHIGHGPVSIIF